MAEPQIATSSPNGSLPPDMVNPPPDSTLISGLQPPTPPQAGLPQSYFDPVVASLSPQPTAPSPSSPPPTPSPQPPAVAPAPAPPPSRDTGSLFPPPAQQPAAAPPTPLVPPAPQPRAAAPAAGPSYTYVGDSIAAGLAQQRSAHQTYEGRDIPAARANTGILASSGRTTGETLAVLNADASRLNGQNVVLSTGISNDLNGGVPLDTAMTNVASQLDALRRAGANVTLLGVGAGVRNSAAANARLAQIAQAYGVPFTGELATTEATSGRAAAVHPSDYGAVFNQLHPGTPQPQTPGTGKTIDDVTAYIQKSEGGGPFILYGHEGQPYDPNTMPTKPGYYGFPDWAGATTSRGPTHAAGGAQWEPDTWKTAVDGFVGAGLANKLGHTPDFRNEADQKAVFNYWADRRYRELTGRDIVADMNAGHVDWTALGPEWESLKYGGGGGGGMTASNTRAYQGWQQSMEDQRKTLEEENAVLQKQLAAISDPSSAAHRALADRLLQKQIQLMDNYEKMIAHPPTQKPRDMLSNFGSLATLIGIFAGRFANRPMVASLNAAGAAMEAMNNNDRQAYTDAFNQWKVQADMTSTLLGMESNAYKGIMDNDRLSMDEKYKQLDAMARIYQNKLMIQQSEAGQYEKMMEMPGTLAKTQADLARSVTELQEAHQKAEEASSLDQAVAADDAAWRTAHPNATPNEIAQAHFDNVARRKGQMQAAGRAGSAEAVQVTYPDGKNEILYGQRAGSGHFVTVDGRDVDLTGATSVLPLTKSQAGTEGMALPDYQGPDQWAGMPSKPPPGIDASVWSLAVDWVKTGKQPAGMGRMDQLTREKLIQAYPVAQQALGIKPEDEYRQSIRYAAEKAREEAIERGFGSGIMGRNLVSLNTVADHISLFRQYAEALRNHDTQRLNQLENRLATETGSPEIINFALAGQITGDEVVRLLTTTGGTVTDRDHIHSLLASYDSPEQLAGAADTLTNFVRSRYEPLRQQYARSDPEKERYFDENMVTPEARQLFTGPPRPPIGPNQTPTTTAPAAAMPHINNQADYDKLPSGTQYIGPDGQTRTKK